MIEKIKSWFHDFAESSGRKILTLLERLPPLASILQRIPRYRIALLGIMGFLIADLATQSLSYHFLRQSGKPGSKHSSNPRVVSLPPFVGGRSRYEDIIRRNSFCPGCPVPDLKMLAVSRPKDCNKAKPIQGALNIIGTIVLSDPRFSVVTVTDGSQESSALKVGDSFKNYGKVFEIRRKRICFESMEGSLSFIELPEDAIKFGQPLVSALPASPLEGISRVSDTEFEIKKSFLSEKLQDPNLLFQANAEPFKDASGAIKGFKILSLQPGSVFEALGLKVEDVIAGVDGEPMNSLARAQELYATLMSGSLEGATIEVLLGGKNVSLKFKVGR